MWNDPECFPEGGGLYQKMTHRPILVIFGSFWEGWSQTLPWTKLFHMHLNKAVPPWRRKRWRKRNSNTMRMQNQAKLAAGACRGRMAEQMSRLMNPCTHELMHWSATAVPAASCVQLPLGGAIFLVGSKIAPPNIQGRNLTLLTELSSSPNFTYACTYIYIPKFFGLHPQIFRPWTPLEKPPSSKPIVYRWTWPPRLIAHQNSTVVVGDVKYELCHKKEVMSRTRHILNMVDTHVEDSQL